MPLVAFQAVEEYVYRLLEEQEDLERVTIPVSNTPSNSVQAKRLNH